MRSGVAAADVLDDASIPGVTRPLCASDLAGGQGLVIGRARVEELSPDNTIGTLFDHPVWLKLDGVEEVVTVDVLARRGRPAQVIFGRQADHLVHLGRLRWFDRDCIALLTSRLLQLPGVGFVVFEDIAVAGGDIAMPRHQVFHYQNNWRLVLNGPAEPDRIARQAAQTTARKLRNFTRDRTGARITFEPSPSAAFLRTIVDHNRDKVESQGRRHGIDEAELRRLQALSAEIGYGAGLCDDEGLVAGDLVAIAGQRAYFMAGGYDPAAQRYSPGMITLVHAVEECRRRGIVDFNLLWGDGVYKARLGARRTRLVTIVARGSNAALLRASHVRVTLRFGWLDLRRRMKPVVMALLRRDPVA